MSMQLPSSRCRIRARSTSPGRSPIFACRCAKLRKPTRRPASAARRIRRSTSTTRRARTRTPTHASTSARACLRCASAGSKRAATPCRSTACRAITAASAQPTRPPRNCASRGCTARRAARRPARTCRKCTMQGKALSRPRWNTSRFARTSGAPNISRACVRAARPARSWPT
jgi:hypothetical protein